MALTIPKRGDVKSSSNLIIPERGVTTQTAGDLTQEFLKTGQGRERRKYLLKTIRENIKK